MGRIPLGLVSVITIFVQAVCAAPVDLSRPPNSLGAANARGYVQIWQEVEEVDFGRGLKLPLRLRFSSELNRASPTFGDGWWCPLLECKAFLKREKMLRAELLCGKVMYLRRDKKDFSLFHSMDRKWIAAVDSVKDTITLRRPSDGWELRYRNGVLQQMRTDSGRILTWYRNGNLVGEIREEGSATSPIRLEKGSDGTVGRLYVNGNLNSFTIGKRPKTEQLEGKTVLSAFVPTLTSWKWATGQEVKYTFELDNDLMPDMKIVESSGKQLEFTWDSATSKIISSKDDRMTWVYKVGSVADELELPRLERVSDSGSVEFLSVNIKSGLTESLSVERGHTITETFVTPGPLYGKVRNIKKKSAKGLFKDFYKAAYDGDGRLVRKTDPNGFTISYIFQEDGNLGSKVLMQTRDPEILDLLKQREQELLEKLRACTDANERNNAIQKLAFFYIHDAKDVSRALPLVKEITDKQILFNVKVHLVDHNPEATPAMKVSGYKVLLLEFPEQKELLEAAINVRTEEIRRHVYAKSK